MTGGRVDRALADLVGGWDGGETLWELACARLARQSREYADEPQRFTSHPSGMLRRLEVACDDALATVRAAVELHEALDHDLPTEERAAQLVDLLLARARRTALERQGLGETGTAATGAPVAAGAASGAVSELRAASP